LKLLKNQLKNNNYNSQINNRNEMSSIDHSKPKKIRNESERINFTESNNNPIKERIKKYKNHTYYLTDLNNDDLSSNHLHKDNTNKDHLNNSLPKHISKNKNQVINKNLINNLKMKNKTNKSYLPQYKDSYHFPSHRNVGDLNKYHNYTLSFKKPKKNIISLNKFNINRSKNNSVSNERIKQKIKNNISIKRDKLNKTNLNHSIGNISSIKSDGFFFKVKNQSYYADYIKGTYDSVIRRVVSTAQVDYLLNNQETYNEINKKN
jgi:hypothetical protein